MRFRVLAFLCAILALSSIAFGQGTAVAFPGVVNPQGQPVPHVQLHFCAPGAITTAGVCSPTVTVYQDQALLIPYGSAIVTDGLGDFPVIWFAPGSYCYSISGFPAAPTSTCHPFTAAASVTGGVLCINGDTGLGRNAPAWWNMGTCTPGDQSGTLSLNLIFNNQQFTAAGTAAAPSHAFKTDSSTGSYLAAPGTYGIAAGGVQVETVTAGGVFVGSNVHMNPQASPDFCLQLQAALTATGNTKAKIDATGFTTNQTCSVNPFANVSADTGLIVDLPCVQITTTAQWYVNNNNVLVRGCVWSGTTLLADPAFPAATPLIKVGDNTAKLISGTRFENIYASCNGVVNCQTYVGSGLNEASGLRHFNSNNTPNNVATPQIQINFGTVTTGHFILEDIQLGTTGNNDGMLITGTAAAMMGEVHRLTCNNTGFVTGAKCLHLNATNAGGATLKASNIHAEGFTQTVYSDGFGSIVGDSIDCSGTCTSIIEINSAKMQSFTGIWGNAGTNLVLNDTYTGCTVTVAQESFLASYRQSATQSTAQVYIDAGSNSTVPNICGTGAAAPRFRILSPATSGAAMLDTFDMLDGNGDGWTLRYGATAAGRPWQFISITTGTPTTVAALSNAGLITTYDGIATADYGVPAIQGTPQHLTGQAGNLGAANLYSAAPPAGVYRVCFDAFTTTSGTGTTMTVSIGWTDAGGAKTFTSATWALNSVTITGYVDGCKIINSSGAANITVSTTGTIGTSAYAIDAMAERMK